MAETNEDIAGLVETLVVALVDDSESVKLDTYEEDGEFHVDITAQPDDVGKIIGRQGHVIKAIRTLARAAAAQAGTSVEVEVLG